MEEKNKNLPSNNLVDENEEGNTQPEPEVVKETVTETVVVKEKKKGSGCLKGCLIALAILFIILLILAGGAFFAYRRAVKTINEVGIEGLVPMVTNFISSEQEDFGVTYTEEDYNELINTLSFESDPSVLCIDCPPVNFSNPKEVSVRVSNQQASASFDAANSSMGFANTQIRFNDGNAELSTTVEFEGQVLPIYLRGSISRISDNSISGNIQSLKVGIIPIPQNIISTVQEELVNRANQRLVEAGDTVRIDTLELTSEGLLFEGKLPTQAN